MAISPIKTGLRKMKYWESEVYQTKPNCNRKDLWELIETKKDFFEKSEKYVKTGLEEVELYKPVTQSETLAKPKEFKWNREI